jgi:phosphatidylinositol alpha-1,6-mannosyltransferase
VQAGGVPADRVRVRGNGFPDPESMPPARGVLRAELGIPEGAQIVLYVGRIASGKGIEHLLAAVRELPGVHLVLVGPDDRHGAIDQIRAAEATGRVHALGATTEPPLHLYPEADVLCLPSAGESFGMAAAEAAAAGTPVVLTDRCGIASFFRAGEAIVVPYGAKELTDAVRNVLGDGELRRSLAAGGVAASRRMAWERVAAHQEEIYREAIASRQASTKASTDGS